MKIKKRYIQKLINESIKRNILIKEERDSAAVMAYYKELRELKKDNPNLTPERKKELRDKYNIASISPGEDGKKRVVFKTDPIDVLVPADEEEV